MNKKRDALRRGIRDLIEDTSRDLVAFEGREPGPHRAVPAGAGTAKPDARDTEVREAGAQAITPANTPALNGGPVESAGDSSSPATPPSEPAAHDPREDSSPPVQTGAPGTALPREAAPADAPAPFELTPGTAFLPPADRPADKARDASGTGRPASRPAPPREAHLSPAPPAQKRPEVPGPAARAKDARTAKRAKPEQRAGGRAAGGHARDAAAPAADDLEADDPGPAPAESRTGVCRSYFVNHDCWRVPNAYCNTALQVCVIRNCPVYHLHKDALERRFAKKFKHLW